MQILHIASAPSYARLNSPACSVVLPHHLVIVLFKPRLNEHLPETFHVVNRPVFTDVRLVVALQEG